MSSQSQENKCDQDAISGLILAGGAGLRVGGQDKGMLVLAGLPLVAHISAALAPQVGCVLVSANRNAEWYATYGDVIRDENSLQQGPLAGIQAGLRACRSAWLCAVPCDALGLPTNLVQQLWRALHSGAGDAADAAYAVVDGNALYPLCLLRQSLNTVLTDFLQAQQAPHARSMRSWLAHCRAVAVPISGWRGPCSNVNTLEDLSTLETQWSGLATLSR